MSKEPKCPECGAYLVDIPFDRCATHDRHFDSLPAMTDEEMEADIERELARVLLERTGDD